MINLTRNFEIGQDVLTIKDTHIIYAQGTPAEQDWVPGQTIPIGSLFIDTINGDIYQYSNSQWVGFGASVSGNNGEVQFNTSGMFDSSSKFYYNKDDNILYTSGLRIQKHSVKDKVGIFYDERQ